MKERPEVFEEKKERLNAALLEKAAKIRERCLRVDTFEMESPSYTVLYALCEQLVASIDLPEELEGIMNELPFLARKIIKGMPKSIASLIDNASSMPALLTILADYPKLQKPIIKTWVEKNIKNVADIRSFLAYASNNGDLQSLTIEVIVGWSKLDTFIKSVGDLCLVLEVLSEDLLATSGKALVEKFVLLFRTQKQLFNFLQIFSKNPRLQELLIETLGETQLAKLRGSGYKTAILKRFEDRAIFYDIVKTAFTAKPNCLVRFFQNAFCKEEAVIEESGVRLRP